jgi:hypothetical protein
MPSWDKASDPCCQIWIGGTGRIDALPDPVRYMSNPPRLTRDGASYLAHAGAIMIGSDTNTL